MVSNDVIWGKLKFYIKLTELELQTICETYEGSQIQSK